MAFEEKLLAIAAQNQSWLCIGLDVDLDRIPAHLVEAHGIEAIADFNKEIVEGTKDLVCAYKPNSAFYESLGPKGLELLKKTREIIPTDIPMILDVKRGDIGNTASKYAQAAFEIYGADAVTLSPYMGWDSIEPFFEYQEKGLFVLCRTSNPGASDFQDFNQLYLEVAQRIATWRVQQQSGRIGAVAGATYSAELRQVRDILGEEAFILVPGIGSQSGNLEEAVRAGANADGKRAIINAARSVIYASSDKDFAEAARAEAQKLRSAINSAVQII